MNEVKYLCHRLLYLLHHRLDIFATYYLLNLINVNIVNGTRNQANNIEGNKYAITSAKLKYLLSSVNIGFFIIQYTPIIVVNAQ